jgi:hypothetical protein
MQISLESDARIRRSWEESRYATPRVLYAHFNSAFHAVVSDNATVFRFASKDRLEIFAVARCFCEEHTLSNGIHVYAVVPKKPQVISCTVDKLRDLEAFVVEKIVKDLPTV